MRENQYGPGGPADLRYWAFLLVAPIALLTACSTDLLDALQPGRPATYELEVSEDKAPIKRICIDDSCITFEEDEAVRSAVHSTRVPDSVEHLVRYEVSLWDGERPFVYTHGGVGDSFCSRDEIEANTIHSTGFDCP